MTVTPGRIAQFHDGSGREHVVKHYAADEGRRVDLVVPILERGAHNMVFAQPQHVLQLHHGALVLVIRIRQDAIAEFLFDPVGVGGKLHQPKACIRIDLAFDGTGLVPDLTERDRWG